MNEKHPWHSITIGDEAPRIVNAVIESSKGTQGKYEVDKESGFLRLDRILPAFVKYPVNYGFIPGTYAGDGDALDILVISDISMVPMSIVRTRVIGAVKMKDDGEKDYKILAAAADDKTVDQLKTIADLSVEFKNELKPFFEEFKKRPGKKVVVEGLIGARQSYPLISKAVKEYRKIFFGK